MSQPIGFYKKDGTTRPISQKGINEKDFKDFKEGSVSGTGIGGPRRQHSSAVPMSELAHAKSQLNYIKSLNERLASIKAGGKARKAEKIARKESQTKEANKNLELANMFMARNEAIQKGYVPPPINIQVDVNDSKTLPKNLKKDERIANAKQQVAQERHESNVIQTMTEPKPKPTGPSPAMAPQEQTESIESILNSERFSPLRNPSKGPPLVTEKSYEKSKSKLSTADLALLQYPAGG